MSGRDCQARHWPRRVFRILRFVVLALVAAVLAAGGWLYWAAKAALPQLDGNLTVPGLTAPVTVIRDAHGVPHLQAGQLEDLFLAQGYVTAEDRLWQLDMIRRYAAGDLSEILGPSHCASRPHAADTGAARRRGTRRGTAATPPAPTPRGVRTWGKCVDGPTARPPASRVSHPRI